jgi:hypothetical protein
MYGMGWLYRKNRIAVSALKARPKNNGRRIDPESDAGGGDGVALFVRLTSTALCYSGKEYSRWLRESEYNSIRVTRPAMAPGYVLVVGRSGA